MRNFRTVRSLRPHRLGAYCLAAWLLGREAACWRYYACRFDRPSDRLDKQLAVAFGGEGGKALLSFPVEPFGYRGFFGNNFPRHWCVTKCGNLSALMKRRQPRDHSIMLCELKSGQWEEFLPTLRPFPSTITHLARYQGTPFLSSVHVNRFN